MFGFKKLIALWRAATAGDTFTYVNEQLVAPSCDLNGNPRAHVVAGSGGAGLDVTTHFGDADAVGVGVAQLVALDTTGLLYGFNGATWDRLRTAADNADAQAALTLGLLALTARNQLFNGTTWDRERGGSEQTLLASAVRNAVATSADVVNYNWIACASFLNITVAAGGGETLQQFLEAKDPVSGNYVVIGTGAAQTAAGITLLQVTPFAVALPRTFRVRVTPSGAGNWTYSVGLSLTKG